MRGDESEAPGEEEEDEEEEEEEKEVETETAKGEGESGEDAEIPTAAVGLNSYEQHLAYKVQPHKKR